LRIRLLLDPDTDTDPDPDSVISRHATSQSPVDPAEAL
jgi:hypothetical protein